jgi:thymidine phosphorylase
VGLADVQGVGAAVGPERPLALVHARDEVGFAAAAERLADAYIIDDPARAPPGIIHERLG